MSLRSFAPCSLALLAVLAAPAVAADLPEEVAGPQPLGSPADVELPSEVKALLDHILVAFAPGAPLHNGLKYQGVDLECHQTVTGETECSGKVCFDQGGSGTLPVTVGDGSDGQTGVGVSPKKSPDGGYGPYVGVFYYSGGHCCAPGVGVVWILA